jgi:hypothetical protein
MKDLAEKSRSQTCSPPWILHGFCDRARKRVYIKSGFRYQSIIGNVLAGLFHQDADAISPLFPQAAALAPCIPSTTQVFFSIHFACSFT